MHMFVSVALHNNALLFFFFSQQVLNYVLCTRARTRFYWSCRRRLYKHLIVTTRWKHRQTASSLSWSPYRGWANRLQVAHSSFTPVFFCSSRARSVSWSRFCPDCLMLSPSGAMSLQAGWNRIQSGFWSKSLQAGWNGIQSGFWSWISLSARRVKHSSGWILINVCAIRLNSKCSLDSDQCLCKQVELKT